MVMRTSYDAIVFDFDGTLIDSSDSIVATFSAVLREHRLPAWDETRIRRSIGRPLREIFRRLSPNGSPSEQDLIDSYVVISKQNGHEEVRLMPGARETLDRFSVGTALGIATSRTSRSTHDILARFTLSERFAAVVGIDMVSRPKPDPESVLLALERLGVEAGRVLLVGDTPDDVRAARAAGVEPVGVTTGAYAAEALREAGASRIVGGLIEL